MEHGAWSMEEWMDEESRKMLQGFKMPEYDNLKREDCLAFGKEILSTTRQS